MIKVLVFLTLIGLLGGCRQTELPIAQEGEDYLFEIKTDVGSVSFVLFDEVPNHKSNFLTLVQDGFYDELLVHRVVPSMLFQFGDPDSKGAVAGKRLGRSEGGDKIDAEFNTDFYHRRGAIAAARKPDQINPEKKSSGSQVYVVQGKVYDQHSLDAFYVKYDSMYHYFNKLLSLPMYQSITEQYRLFSLEEPSTEELTKFILNYRALIENEFGVELLNPRSNNSDDYYMEYGGMPGLDNQYTVFGQVVMGFDVLEKITAVKIDRHQRPHQDIQILSLDYKLIQIDQRDSLLNLVGVSL